MPWVFLVLLGLVVLAVWVHELLYLLHLPDHIFPGRYDKVLWFCVVFLGGFLGALIFYGWRTYTEVEARLVEEMRAAWDETRCRAKEGPGAQGE